MWWPSLSAGTELSVPINLLFVSLRQEVKVDAQMIPAPRRKLQQSLSNKLEQLISHSLLSRDSADDHWDLAVFVVSVRCEQRTCPNYGEPKRRTPSKPPWWLQLISHRKKSATGLQSSLQAGEFSFLNSGRLIWRPRRGQLMS